MTRRPVYLAGAGAITPLGARWPAAVDALARGQSAIAPIELFDTTGFPCAVAATIPASMTRDLDTSEGDRRVALALAAGREAWHAARDVIGPVGPIRPERVGVFVGAESGRGSFATIGALARAAGGGKEFDHQAFARTAPARRELIEEMSPMALSPAAVAARLAREIDAHGPVHTISLACASGAAAIIEAARAIRHGVCDVALCGGVGADVDPLMLAGFGLLGALSARGVSCPFDVRRDGFVLGEGAAMVVLAASPSHAVVEVAGMGRSLDAYRLTAPEPEGAGAELAMRAALADAGLDAAARDTPGYVQAHGTSTPLNDAAEAAALGRVFGGALARIKVSSVKGALGHWIAGAGALGFLCAALAVERGTLLPTAGLIAPDPACPLDHVRDQAAHAPVTWAMCNSFAFGGANCCIVVRSCA
jgi:3-oxoacyl-[acyl-carrier-protein] synthase II